MFLLIRAAARMKNFSTPKSVIARWSGSEYPRFFTSAQFGMVFFHEHRYLEPVPSGWNQGNKRVSGQKK
jgi:hypothetical protein